MDCDSNAAVSSNSSTYTISATHERIYVAWVNSQLRKAGCAQISKLQECADGAALVSLMEVLAGERLTVAVPARAAEHSMRNGVDKEAAASEKERIEAEKANEQKLARVQAVLEAMHERRIRMSAVSAAEVVSGDQRAIMRVVLALAAHFKPTTSRMQHMSTSVVSEPGVKRDQTWQSLRDTAPAPGEDTAEGRFERSVTFDGAQSLQHCSEPEVVERDSLFSHYSKMSDAEKLSTVLRRGGSKRQEWLERRRRTSSPDHSLAQASTDNSSPCVEPHEARKLELNALNDVRETRVLLSKLQRTILLNRVDDVDGAALDASTPLDEPFDSDCMPPTHASAEAECVVLRSRLDVALAKQRELATCLQHTRVANNTLARANAALRIRVGDADADADADADSQPLSDQTAEQRVAFLESELRRLRSELSARDRLIVELLGSTHAHLESQTNAAPLDDVDELSALTSRTLSAYSPSHENSTRFAFDSATLPRNGTCEDEKACESEKRAFNGHEDDEEIL